MDLSLVSLVELHRLVVNRINAVSQQIKEHELKEPYLQRKEDLAYLQRKMDQTRNTPQHAVYKTPQNDVLADLPPREPVSSRSYSAPPRRATPNHNTPPWGNPIPSIETEIQ